MSDHIRKYCYFRIVVISVFILTAARVHCQNDIEWNLGTYPSVDFTDQEYETLKDLSEEYYGQTKLKSIKHFPFFVLSQDENWPSGSWGRGYFTDIAKESVESFLDNTLQDQPIACHPLYRKTSKFGRGHLHLFHLSDDNAHLQFVKDGVDYLLKEVHKNGGYIQWNNRCSKTDTSHAGKNGACYENHPDLYPSSYALRFLCEVSLSGINYENTNVNEAIVKTADFLIEKMNSEGLGNSNNKGLVSWALAGSYKVTLDCKYLNAAKQICTSLIESQTVVNGIEHGIWKTGGLEYNFDDGIHDDGIFQYYHDTRIYYHFMAVRGMIETLSIVQDEDESFKERLVFSIKSAINHVLNYRINQSDGLNLYATSDAGTTVNFTPFFSDRLSGEYVEPIMLLAKYTLDNQKYFNAEERETLINFANKLAKTMQDRLVFSDDESFKRNLITGIGYYARYKKAIENDDQVLQWNNTQSTLEFESTEGNYVSGDFDNDGNEDDIATFSHNQLDGTSIHVWNSTGVAFVNQDPNGWWSSGNFNLEKAAKKIVSGDFDNDTFKDDIAAFYDTGNGQTNIRVWLSTGSSFVYQGDAGWEAQLSYNSDKIKWRVVSGDFDGDNFDDDIAALYAVDSGGTRLDTWISDGNSFNYQNAGWWNSSSYNANKVTGRVLSGDFDRDGDFDDIGAFYDAGNDVTKVHVWSSNGSSFDYQDSAWWSKTGYPASKLTGRVVAGNFDGDKYNDNIAGFYDVGNNKSQIHTWSSNGGSLNYSGNQGWWESTNYNSADISGKIVGINFNDALNLDHIAVFNNHGKYNPRIHVWKSQGSSFYYTGDDSWWLTCAYNPPITFDGIPLEDDDEWDFEYKASIYPNPTVPEKNELNIDIEGFDGGTIDYEITSLSGVYAEKGTSEKTVNVSNLEDGFYIVVFTYKDQKFKYRFIKL